MSKNIFKIGVASLAVTAMLATSAATEVSAQKSTSDHTIDWNKKIVQRMLDQLSLIQQHEGSSYSITFNKETLKVVINKLVSHTTTKPEVKPEVEKPEVTPTPEVKPEVEKPEATPTPEIKPEVEKPEVTPTPEAKPEVEKPEATPAPEVKPEETTPEAEKPQVDQSEFTIEQQEVLAIVNKERTSRGLKALVLDAEVSKVAMEKARDMDVNNYFNHQSPTYGSPFDMLTTFGVKYNTAGENIAYGQKNADEVMNAWMNSTGHRNNILSSSYTKIGIGFVNGKWVQLFIG